MNEPGTADRQPTSRKGENVANAGANGDRLATLEHELEQERRARQGLVAASVRLNSLLNLPDLLNATMEAATELLDAETSSLMLLDEGTFELTFTIATGEPGESVKELRVPADQGIAGWVLEHNEPLIVNDAAGDPRFYEEIDQASGFTTRSLLAVPLTIRETQIGVVEVINKQGDAGFTARDQDLATALAAQAAVAIDNARLYHQLADALVASRMSYRL
jgi:GAF domain-containing protein